MRERGSRGGALNIENKNKRTLWRFTKMHRVNCTIGSPQEEGFRDTDIFLLKNSSCSLRRASQGSSGGVLQNLAQTH